MARANTIAGTVLVVSPCEATAALLEEPALAGAAFVFEQADDPQAAIGRIEAGELVDVVLLAPDLADPVRVAQRLHSLDRDGAVVALAEPGGLSDLRRALSVAPFLAGDVAAAATGDAEGLAEQLRAAVARTRTRRERAGARKERRTTPPPLSASYLGTLLDSVPLGIVTLDAGGCVMGWNRRAGQMLDTPEVQALGKSFAALFGAEDAERLATLIDRLGSEGIEEQTEVFHRDGRAFDISGARFAIRSGEPGALLILQDVTKREAAEQALRLQKALSDAQGEASESGIVLLSLDGQVVRANRRFTELWGVSEADMRDPSVDARALFVERVEDPDQFVSGMERLAATGDGEFRDEVVLKDGRVIERYAAHARDDSGNVVGRIWFHTDVTARKREEDALRFLADATNLLSSSLDYELTLQHVADLAVSKIADWCSVDIVADGGTHRSIAMAGPDADQVAQARRWRREHPDVESGNVAGVIASGESRVLNGLTPADVEAMAQSEEHRELLHAFAIGSLMFAPIKVRDRVFGAISLIRSRATGEFDDEDIRLAEELARRAAIAVDNSRVHAQLRDTARTLQESLLPPHLPAVRGLELAARFRPAGAGMQVGGDFYDIFEVGPEQWAIAVGDVCGKGADAAAVTALTRYTVRAAAMYEKDAAGVLRVLNEALIRQRGDLRFTTLAFCILDLGSKPAQMLVATAGHPKPLVLCADGRTLAVGATGPLLGVMQDAEFADEQVELADGDAIVLYTDGLTDALAPAQMLGEADLMRALSDAHGLSAGDISLRLEQTALAGDMSRVPRDDIALIVAKLS